VFLVNSRLDLFTAAPSGSLRKGVHPTGAPLLPKLRGEFAEFLDEGYLDHLGILYLSTCVGLGTGTRVLPRGFSWRHGFRDSPAFRPAGIAPRINTLPDLPGSASYVLTPGRPSPGFPYPSSSPHSVITDATWYGNINPLAIDYAFRPRLRSRLTLSRRTLLRKPWTIGGGDSHPSFVTHAGILTSRASTTRLRGRFAGVGTLSYRVRVPKDTHTRSFGDLLEPRYIFRARTLDQ
jgi:hypothetical protein